MNTRLFLLSLIFISINLNFTFSQTFTVSGYVKDARSGETLIGVNVYNKANNQQGTSTNTYGFYSLSLPKGKYILKISFVGYADTEIEMDLSEDKALNLLRGSSCKKLLLLRSKKTKT